MTSHFNKLTPAEAERLALLLEEMGEAQQAIGKILRHGYESKHPSKPDGPTNRESLEREVGDVLHAIWLLMKQDISEAAIGERRSVKSATVQLYFHHQTPWREYLDYMPTETVHERQVRLMGTITIHPRTDHGGRGD